MIRTSIPWTPLVLGLAGVIPFLLGAFFVWVPPYEGSGENPPGVMAIEGLKILEVYGIIILCFMSGVLWGFATKSERIIPFVLSVLPALWVFYFSITESRSIVLALLVGFLGVFTLDVLFQKWGLTPSWWVKLRAILTAIVCGCLAIGVMV